MGDVEPGTKIAGKYTLVGRGGRGGMADVWIARNEATGADVAIKMLRPERRNVDDADERFRQEARVSAKVTHPNVARVYDLVEENGMLLLVMERLRGDTLRRKLAGGALPEKEVVDLCLPILDGLSAVHAVGIIHRDVTPGNIFLAEEGGKTIPKLIDFGVAKHDESAITTKTGHALGTPQYMSPEQIRSVRLDARSDLYSLAVTMFEAITGANPYRRESASSSLAAVLETEIDPDPRISPRVWLVLSRALAKQPYERPVSAEEMATMLRHAVRGSGADSGSGSVEPRDESVSSDLSGQIDVPHVQPVAKRPWGLLAAAFAFLALVVIAAAALLKRETTPTTPTINAAQPPAPPPTIVVSVTTPAATTVAPSIDPPATSASTTIAKPTSTQQQRTTVPVKATTTTTTGKTKPVATTPGF